MRYFRLLNFEHLVFDSDIHAEVPLNTGITFVHHRLWLIPSSTFPIFSLLSGLILQQVYTYLKWLWPYWKAFLLERLHISIYIPTRYTWCSDLTFTSNGATALFFADATCYAVVLFNMCFCCGVSGENAQKWNSKWRYFRIICIVWRLDRKVHSISPVWAANTLGKVSYDLFASTHVCITIN